MVKKLVQKAFLVFFGLFLIFVILEIGMRLAGKTHLGINAKDPENGFITFKPNSNLTIKSECFDNIVKTNSIGFHSSEYSKEKPKNVFRIAVVGDSFTEAIQVPLKKTYFSILEQKLNEELSSSTTLKYEIMSFGLSSHGTYKNLMYAREYALRYNPDLIIDLFFSSNDITDDFWDYPDEIPVFDKNDKLVFPKAKPVQFSLKQKIKDVARKSILIEHLHKYYITAKINYKTKSGKDQKPIGIQIYLAKYPQLWKDMWQKEEKLFQEFQSLAKENKSKFLLVSRPRHGFLHPEEFDKSKADIVGNGDMEDYDFDKPEKLLAQIASSSGMLYLNLHPHFQKKAQKDTKARVHWTCDGHWNETGHEWAADGIYQFLIDNPNIISKVNNYEENN